jgi:hypothetical protein
MADTIQTSEIPPSVLEQVGRRVIDSSVGLVKFATQHQDEAILAGSGTLVQIGEFHAVLTASHVVEELWTSSQFGLILSGSPSSSPHRIVFETALVRAVRVARGSSLCESEPPDIALIIVPDTRRGDISARKSFYNLASNREKILPNCTLSTTTSSASGR